MKTPRAYVRRVLERLGERIDPAGVHLDADVDDESLARVLAMVEALKVKVARISETYGLDPTVVWGDPAPRSGEAWAAEEAAYLRTRTYQLRYFTPQHPTRRCACGRPAVKQVLVGWRERRVSEEAPEAVLAWVCETPATCTFKNPSPIARFARSDRPVDEL